MRYKKIHKPKVSFDRREYKNLVPVIGIYGLKVLESGRINVKCLESARRVLLKKLKKEGKVLINVFPHYSITSKPQEVRMGKGKGDNCGWLCLVSAGSILFEIKINSVDIRRIKSILRLAGERIGLKTIFVKSIG